MTGEEYSEAEKKYGLIIEIQQKRQEELKQCHNELNQQKEIIKQTVTDQDKKIAEGKLSIQRAKYNQARYPTKHLLAYSHVRTCRPLPPSKKDNLKKVVMNAA